MKLHCRNAAGRKGVKLQRSGTTLIELLVVIVIFLIGILAVIQIFPKGFQLLVGVRNNTVAVHLASDEMERLRQHADQLPERIVAVHYNSPNTPIEDPNRNPFDLGPDGDSIDTTGALSMQGVSLGNWLLHSGPNAFRRIIAEGTRVPSPRPVGSNYGGLMVLNFGPIDANAPLSAYSNDLTKDVSLPQNLAQVNTETETVTIGTTTINSPLLDSTDSLANYEYFVGDSAASTAFLLLPTNSSYARTYHIRLGAYILSGGNTLRQDYPDLFVQVPQTSATDAAGNTPPLVEIPISAILADTPGALPTGATFVSPDFDSIQVAPEYNAVATANSFTGDPLEYKLLDSDLGVLLFSPSGYGTFVERPGGPREPLMARVNYDVYDWRVLRQEFRLDSQVGLNGGDYGQIQLNLQSIKVGTGIGPDGLQNGPIVPVENSSTYSTYQNPLADNLVIEDLQTGGVVCELDPNDKHQVISVNKSTGVVTVSGDGTGGLIGNIIVPGSSSNPLSVDLTGRSLRAMYRARNEYSVNILKAAAAYTLTNTSDFSGEGQAFFSSGILEFPRSDLHQQITIDTVNYTDAQGPHEINGQSFQIEAPTTNANGLPQVNLLSVLPNPANSTITGISGIKGSSILAQVLWNPSQFHFTTNASTNVSSVVNTWEHDWRINRTESTIPSQELQ